ncbi:hypothetical protein [Streptomyces longwoodensis]
MGRSGLDLLVALHEEPTDTDREGLREFERILDTEFEQGDGVATLLYSRARVLSEPERYALPWFITCLCSRVPRTSRRRSRAAVTTGRKAVGTRVRAPSRAM